jgi:hypothetical protein
MQSLAYGTPVITHDNPYAQSPEFESIVPGVNGDLFKHDDLESLAEVIRRWTLVPKSPEVERNCHRMIERFYNPAVQTRLIREAIYDVAANDVEMAKWTKARVAPAPAFIELPTGTLYDSMLNIP